MPPHPLLQPWRLAGAVTVALVASFFLIRSRKPVIVRRAAFDIGSGASKVLVADVDSATGVVVGEPLYETERPMAFKADAQQSADGSLSAKVIAEGLELIESLAATARRLGATEAAGIATEVFRTAPNGSAFLESIAQRTGVRIATLSQQMEARLGLATAEALLGGPALVRAAWDSGGGSFQITSRERGGEGAPCDEASVATAELRTYVGKLGTGPSFHRLLTAVQRKAYDATATVNPASAADATRLVKLLQGELPVAPAWLKGQPIVAIGGWNCIFATTLRALRTYVGGSYAVHGSTVDATDSTAGAAGGMSGGSFTVEDARKALAAVCDRSDDELLAIAGTGAEAERAAFVVPKVALLVAVAAHLGVSRIRFVPATGGCAGLMALGSFSSLPRATPTGTEATSSAACEAHAGAGRA